MAVPRTRTRTRTQMEDHASLEEVAMAVASLTEADLARLAVSARLRARGLLHVDWQDLLHDAVQRALDGTRRWPAGVPFAVFLREVIRSLASEAWRLQARERSHRADGLGADALANVPDHASDPEETALARDLAALLERLFEGDRVALGILASVAEGLSPAEIQVRLKIGPTEYDSARRRIRRRIAAAPEMFL